MSSNVLEFLRTPALTGGLDETAQRLGALSPSDLVQAQNAIPAGAGRLGLRPHLIAGPTLTDADAVLAAIDLGGKAIFIGWDDGNDAVLLYEWDWVATSVAGKTFDDATADAGARWSTGVAAPLGISITVFEDAVFLCSTDRSKALAFYSLGDADVSLVPKVNLAAGTDNHIKPGSVWVHRNHLFTSGWQDEDNPDVSHAIRWSKPGTAKLAGDWNAADFDYVGAEGEAVRLGLPISDEQSVIFKARSIHALYGYQSSNFALRRRVDGIGCAGPRAAAQYSGSVAFWDQDAKPRVLGQPIALDRPVLESLSQRDFTDEEKLWVGVYPEYDCFLFAAPFAGEDAATELLVLDARGPRWLGFWDFPGASLTALRGIFASASLVRQSVAGPAAPPSSLDAVADHAEQTTETWVNGDNSTGTVTILEREETAPDTVAYADISGEIPVADPSVYVDTGVTEKSTYTYRARHKRNGIETAVGDRPTDQVLTPCLTAPITQVTEEPASAGKRVLTVHVTGRSGRSGAASTITLERKGFKETSYTQIQQWTGREDEGAPVALQHSDDPQVCGSRVEYRTRVSDEASTWPNSDYETFSHQVTPC